MISVIIPTFKPQDYIFECLQSLAAQTLSPKEFEVFIILNGCNEPWHSRIKQFIDANFKDITVKLIQTDTPGVSNARNIGLDACQGDYITFIDDDDYVSPHYLERLSHIATPDTVAVSDSLSFKDGSVHYDTSYSLHILFEKYNVIDSPSLFMVRSYFNGPVMKLFPRSVIGERRFDVRFANGEDNLMMYNISDRIKNIRFTSSDAVYYRRYRQDSAVTRSRSMSSRIKNVLKLMGQYTKILLRHPFSYNYPFVLSRYAAEIKSLLS